MGVNICHAEALARKARLIEIVDVAGDLVEQIENFDADLDAAR